MRAMKVIGIAGWSGAGKTTLLTRVIPRLTARGLRVSTLKHAHHDFDVDQPGKDFAHASRGGRDRGADLVGQSLRADARVARRAGTGRCARCWQSSRRSISCWSRASSARRIRSSKSFAPRRQAAAASGRSEHRGDRERRAAVAAQRAGGRRSTTSRRSRTFWWRRRAPLDAVLARACGAPDGPAHRRLLRVRRAAARRSTMSSG